MLALLIVQLAVGIVALVEITRGDGDDTFQNAAYNATKALFDRYNPSDENEAVHYIQYTVSLI